MSGARRVRTLWRLFRAEKHDPAPFYRMLAAELARDLEARHGPLDGQLVLDLGCGPGWYADALRAHGAVVVPVERDLEELVGPEGAVPPGAVLADAGALPVPDGRADGVVCSNLLEHTPDPAAVLRAIGQVLRPGGWGYVSWTNWYSPWGGHDMTPWHLLGPNLGPRVYERVHGPPRKNRYGEGLFAAHIGDVLRAVRADPGLDLVDVKPRYWPWARAITRVPGVREVATWNCVLRVRRRPGSDDLRRTLDDVAGVEGWLSDDQATRLWDRAHALADGARIVEIGSYQGRSAIVAARAAPACRVVAIDPHAGNDRGPQQWEGTADEGEADHRAFLANLTAAGVVGRVDHVRRFSHDALDEVPDGIDLLYIDGAHGYRPALDDIRRWGAKVAPGGTLLIHDAFSSIGVTLALMRSLFLGRDLTYVGRSRSMVEYRRDPVRGLARLRNAARQAASLPWFARNVVIKVLIVARLGALTRFLGHREATWPY